MNKNQSNVPLLPITDRPNPPSPNSEQGKCCKATTIILVVLLICGILAFGLSVVVWQFFDESNIWVPGNTDISTIWIVVILFLCGILVLGLPAVVWKYYDSLETPDQKPDPPILNVPIIKPEVLKIIRSAPKNFNKRIIGYYSEFESRDIRKSQLEKLTHAIVACVTMDKNGKLQFKNEMIQQRFLSLISKSKNLESVVKMMFSIGGYDNSEHFSTMVKSSRSRRKFSNSIISFIKEHQIDGVNIFWEQPSESQKFKYSKFLKKLRRKLDKHGSIDNKKYVLSIVAPRAGIGKWEFGFDLDGIIDHVDFINVISMDYYGPWPNEWGTPVGPSAPLYSGVGPKSDFNVNYTMQYYICETKKPEKLNIVIPFYVRLWRNVKERLKPESQVFRNAELKNGKVEGDPYMSRWTVENEGWKLKPASWDEETKTSFIYDHAARTFLTFEDDKSVDAKMKYVDDMNLGGVWIWSVHTDDDDGTLLNAILSNSFLSQGYSNNETKSPV